MDDYSALAYRIAGGVADVRGCLILSRDGLILGSYPDDETAVKPAWVRFASLGDPERSFVEFGDQVWVYVRRPAYGAFAVANAGVRPGLVIDQLEGILASAEESRNRRDTLRVPEASGGPRAKAPTSSYRPPAIGGPSAVAPASSRDARHWVRAARPVVGVEPDAEPDVEEMTRVPNGVRHSGDGISGEGRGAGSADAATPGPDEDPDAASAAASDDAPDDGAAADAGVSGDTSDTNEAKDGDPSVPMDLDADAEVDPVMLAKEFSGLLQVESGDDEASS